MGSGQGGVSPPVTVLTVLKGFRVAEQRKGEAISELFRGPQEDGHVEMKGKQWNKTTATATRAILPKVAIQR